MKPQKVAALEGLIRESQRVLMRLREAMDEIHADLELSRSKRSLLRQIRDQGPVTVPELARARAVSRQHVQTVVNELRARGLVKLIENPTHRRSSLVRLNKAGRKMVRELDRRERRIWRLVNLRVKRRDLDSAAGVLARFGQLLDSDAWHDAVNGSRD